MQWTEPTADAALPGLLEARSLRLIWLATSSFLTGKLPDNRSNRL